ncbi:4-hydroxythreonine-4-phosphate dehydrogenase [Brevundimonas sp. EAKA]|jgi:4-hydroxythreonine-4-phosphate dehydrogenase|uniref:4-hydroxythreonine-4-phosphate dehydrogenase n=1 Tax=Brevundimonas mediterranea TaxID=74329 RepID=A0A6G7ELH7_9CAUL|nr:MULTISPECIES: 4-hydroxythreonine-4-phosphate dehydrogenase PdxA [Brevundimonas]MBU4198046.1 4-hydroxythreonine-4-phosphate dehydrogenase PdxA [Alphaproteobacteria bacterium]MDZ4374866.1 4-hydroxythreonine-4-phosphate dehydrogenase PdxA [Phenylobacterium sp.]OGN43118.1 MAG: 4-hydroxythreonine-4-phosphate dehydrogenase PdxA [Caulobacterales bacterium GWE1_67_11]OGN48385.1 MAG: 4-hydroxythreonine-4-phosphate dehydrogenase PdxA [Caulobacterales bacterium RIFCSPHIGHO2_12_FULL_68_13]EDX81978.1 4-
MTRPLVLTLGEPAGVGPEIVAAAWNALKTEPPAFAVIGDADLLRAQGVLVVEINTPADALQPFGRALPVIHRPLPAAVEVGRPDPANAPAVADGIEEAVSFVLSGEASGLVTAPIAKAPMYASGFRFPGHTEFIAELTADAPYPGTRGPVMMLTAKDLRACLVTIHVALGQVAELITADRVARTARVVHESLKRDFAIARPRLAMAALNPHAGEGGALGVEEIETLRPVAAQLRAEGIDITDPRPADTLFHDEARAGYDAALCMYHDQALIPVKTLDFWGGVNVSLGLPIIRTSPDHGTGFDIAGQGIARADSLIAAVRLASEMAAARAAR